MLKRRSMTRNQTRGGVTWSDLNHDVLYSVMMRLGVFDFLSFSGVCKSWRSLAVSNRNSFMASKPPMAMLIHPHANNKKACYLKDFEGRNSKTIIPHSANRTCVGVTCGYLILFGEETHDFWLVNVITGHKLYFPGVNFDVKRGQVRAILVFSTSVIGWVFVILNKLQHHIWFSIAGKGAWYHVSANFPVLDLLPFKGKLYILSTDNSLKTRRVYEMRLDPVPKLTLLDTHFLEGVYFAWYFISSDENLYLLEYFPYDLHTVHKLDFEGLSWAPCEKTKEEYVLFNSCLSQGAAVKPESWAGPLSQYERFFNTDKLGKGSCLRAKFWYYPHDCLNVAMII